MEDQLEQAITIAWGGSDAALRQQAIEYCTDVRNSDDGWQVCLSMVTGEKERSDATRHFALQVIDNALTRLPEDQVDLIRTRLFEYLRRMVTTRKQPEAAHMRNKLGQTIAYVFILAYMSQWTTFFDDLFSLMASETSEVGNAQAVDMYLRILKTIHEEIGDNLISRSREMVQRNNVIKDLIRDRAMTKLASSWSTILQFYTTRPTEPVQLGRDTVDITLKVVGGWVSWMDITLIVNPTFMNLIFNLLANPDQRLSACDALCEIIAKKMKPADKLELIQLLNPSSLIAQLPTSDDPEFDERIAKLTNIVASEAIRVMDGTMQNSSGVQVTQGQVELAEEILISMMPIIFGFLSNEYDDTASQVFPCIGDYLAYIRIEAKKQKDKVDTTGFAKNTHGQFLEFPADSTFVPSRRLEILRSMLEKIILKMKYDDSTDWTGGEDESESEFLDVRKRLKILQTQIASIDQDLYREGIVAFVNGTLDGQYGKHWQDVELGLFELSAYSEAIRNSALPTIRGVETKTSIALSELFFKMVNSDIITTVNHPSVHLLYMDLAERHASFFVHRQQADSMRRVLEVFLSPLGVHNTMRRVKVRAWYLFFRFIKVVQQIVGDIAEQIYSSLRPLLAIKAEVPQQTTDSDSDGSTDDNSFASQLYLFEVCGIIFASAPDSSAHVLTQSLLQPVFSDIEAAMNENPTQSDSQAALQIHHDLMAISSFSKGLVDSAGKPGPAVVQEIKNASQAALVVVERLPQLSVIRSSSRSAISSILPLLKSELLPELTRLIRALLEGSNIGELSDFLSFLGQLMHSYKSDSGVLEMFTELLGPLVEKLVVSMNQAESEAATGSTDAILLHHDLRRSYLSFLYNAFNNDMSAIFTREQNRRALNSVLESVLTYAKDIKDPGSQKIALATLSIMFNMWSGGPTNGQSLEGFDDSFVFSQYSGAIWEVIGKEGFNVRDAQIRVSVKESANLQRNIYEHKGNSYATYLLESYLPAIGMPAELIQEYIQGLTSLNTKDFQKFYIDFVTRLSR